MKMRCPAIPLITVDPYFSVWAQADTLNDRRSPIMHWTGSPNTMLGTVTIDGALYRFLGKGDEAPLPQVSLDVNALSTTAIYENRQIRLTARFTTPILADDLYYVSRPVSYLKLSYESLDGSAHEVRAKISVSEELVLNQAGEGRAYSEPVDLPGISCLRMGSGAQKVLWRSGDDVRIDWGYFYLAVKGPAQTGNEVMQDLYAIYAETALEPEALFLFAYDDIDSIIYFEKPLQAYWKQGGKTIQDAIREAAAEYTPLLARCEAFSAALEAAAIEKGNAEYADLLLLAYRHVMAAHKLVVDEDGTNLYISKECFSNGCAATVDVTYPSAPMYLYYNTELLKGMLRPVFRFAESPAWPYDFAPHDVGRYPILNGQFYGMGLQQQMPVEECGNMITLTAAICKREQDYSFAREHLALLEKWNRYLVEYGEDPAQQLCTDDFAGHMAHNCNLSLKAMMGMSGFARILQALGRGDEAAALQAKARDYANSFLTRALNEDGSYRLAYDRPGTFSLKYNAVWDKLWGLGLLPASFYEAEIQRYKKEAFAYGVPLDSRERYTKSDWELWAACLAEHPEDFAFFVHLLHLNYETSRDRVPMTDWYYADTAQQFFRKKGKIHQGEFQQRSVQGGLFLKLLF